MILKLTDLKSKGAYIPSTELPMLFRLYIRTIRSNRYNVGIMGSKENSEFLVDHLLPRILRHSKTLQPKNKRMFKEIARAKENIARFKRDRKTATNTGRSIHIGARVSRSTEERVREIAKVQGKSKSLIISELIEKGLEWSHPKKNESSASSDAKETISKT